MSIVAVGINHKTAPVAVREKISFNPDNLSVALKELLGNVECREAAILSTCNRTELYLVQEGDVTVTQDGFSDWKHDSKTQIKSASEVDAQDDIIDYGPETAAKVAEIIKTAGTILWNGPVGVFEMDAFAKGTEIISQAIADSSAFSIAGGGDTLAAVDKYDIKDKVSYISTGGGAFLEFLEGKKLPAVEILEQRAQEQ